MTDLNQSCTYCDRPAWTGNVVNPPVCQMHLDLMLIIMRVQASRQPVTLVNVLKAYGDLPSSIRVKLSIKHVTIAGLMREMRERGAFDGRRHTRRLAVRVGRKHDLDGAKHENIS